MSDEPRDVSGQIEDAVGEALLDIIKNGAKEVTKDGEIVTITAPASYFTAAVAYLKQRPPKGQPALGGAKGKLKEFLEGEGNVLPFGSKKQESA